MGGEEGVAEERGNEMEVISRGEGATRGIRNVAARLRDHRGHRPRLQLC